MDTEKEIRPEGTGLAYGKYLTKPKAKSLGVRWASQVGDTLAGQNYKPSPFQELWDGDNEEEEQEESQNMLLQVYQKLLDIFCRLFIKEE